MRKLVIVAAVLANATLSQDISRDLPYLSIDIRKPPVAPRTVGGYLLEYELFVTNWYDRDVTISGVEMLLGDALLAAFRGEALNRLFVNGQTAVLGPRQTATMVLSGVAGEL